MYFLVEEDEVCVGYGETPQLAFERAAEFNSDINLGTVKVYEAKEVKLIISVDPDSRS